ncbi:hypothetical protein HAP47_0021225 [Bradyrhizobium sp. 41S5]|uniref:hypothetical protein n=1 Tax=Bradyrhizobium sp. 41S5 TaxID=1404443 RepID=UPI00156AFD70|nr:hypothetical protein [Bradyrhizobium sp. 41S5]UFX41829.1 hypothetical protein HAP47_0021225 [Bradyrhizobium sp. 41S5]
MTYETRAETIQLKDLMLIVPFMASTIAITWEVGRLLPFGGFRLFSISDHLLSALSSLPIALYLCATAPLVTYFLHRAATKAKRKKPVFAVFAITSLILIIAGVFFMPWFKVTIVLMEAFVVVALAQFLWPFLPQRALPVAAFGSAVLFTFALAYESSLVVIREGKTVATITTVALKSGTVEAIVLMTGERGILLFDPTTDRISFLKADEMQKLDWSRTPRH